MDFFKFDESFIAAERKCLLKQGSVVTGYKCVVYENNNAVQPVKAAPAAFKKTTVKAVSIKK